MGSGTGYYNNQRLFHARENHGSFVPLSGLLKASDFDHGTSNSSKLPRRQKLVDEIELKRRSNSQQERLADYKMRQTINRLKNNSASNGGNSSNATDDNFSPSILGSLENEVDWTPSGSQSSPPRPNRFQHGGGQERHNDLSLIQGTRSPKGAGARRDPYASEDFVVSAQGMFKLGNGAFFSEHTGWFSNN